LNKKREAAETSPLCKVLEKLIDVNIFIVPNTKYRCTKICCELKLFGKQI